MDQKYWTTIIWTLSYIALSKIWTKNHGTKFIWIKLAWEQVVCKLKEFG